MPQNGEVNEKFGVYKNACCGAEIVLSKGATFPVCPKHPNLPTFWQLVDENEGRLTEKASGSESDPAA